MCLAVPGHIVRIKKDRAEVSVNGVIYDAGTALAEKISVGDWVLIHAGFILEKLEMDEALLELETIKKYTNLIN